MRRTIVYPSLSSRTVQGEWHRKRKKGFVLGTERKGKFSNWTPVERRLYDVVERFLTIFDLQDAFDLQNTKADCCKIPGSTDATQHFPPTIAEPVHFSTCFHPANAGCHTHNVSTDSHLKFCCHVNQLRWNMLSRASCWVASAVQDQLCLTSSCSPAIPEKHSEDP